MGEIADSVLDGACCEWCGVFFAKEHGHPVVCTACWTNSSASERAGHQRATEAEL